MRAETRHLHTTTPRVSDPAVWAGAAGLVLVGLAVTVVTGWVDWSAAGRWLRPQAATVGLFASGVFLMVAGVIGWVRAGTRERDRPSPSLSWWAVVAAAAVVAAVVWGATAWLLREAGSAKDPAAARVEAIKTGLAIGAGTGGVFALLLAVRRQWHQERSSAATELDAAERRVTELYTKAADQLGSDKAPVRLAGLYALERVAQDNEKHRQTIVNVLCAYLRMPYQVPGDPPAEAADKEAWAAHRELIQEREVRLAAQRILTNHLRPGENTKQPVATFWKAIDLNLTGATLIDLSLFKCVMRDARFRSATFIGGASFGYATVSGYAVFDSATFDGAAEFMSASLQYGGFKSSTFRGVAEFRSASFGAAAGFDSSTFQGAADFREATFAGEASFESASFTGDVDFSSASFEFVLSSSEYAALMLPSPGLVGRYSLSLKLATFKGATNFERATFVGDVELESTSFERGTPDEMVRFLPPRDIREIKSLPADDTQDDAEVDHPG